MDGLAALDYEGAESPKAQLVTNLHVTFFVGPGGENMIEIRNNADGGKNTLIQRVDDTHIRRWPQQWAAFGIGREKFDAGGTPLTEVPGIDDAMAAAFKLRGVPNVETLAGLDDITVGSLGMGALTARRAARLVIQAKRADALEALLNERTAPAPSPASSRKAA